LLDNGAEIDVPGLDATPLSLAAMYGREAIVQLLLHKGACADYRAYDAGPTLLIYAAATAWGDDFPKIQNATRANIMSLLLDAGADPEDKGYGRTAWYFMSDDFKCEVMEDENHVLRRL
jgi:ankyrin repeat protein